MFNLGKVDLIGFGRFGELGGPSLKSLPKIYSGREKGPASIKDSAEKVFLQKLGTNFSHTDAV
jgi:hypothetical protein